MMKKVLIFALMIGSIGLVAPAAEARAAEASVGTAAEISQVWRQRRRGRRVVTTTRIRRVGPYRYRETIRVTYLPNGRTRTQVIRRVRLTGGRRW
jgi:hypothetical protein